MKFIARSVGPVVLVLTAALAASSGLPRPARADGCAELPRKAKEEALRVLPDRPDVSESSYTVPPGHLQWEAGVFRARGDSRRVAVDSLFRVGTSKNWEVRLGGLAPAHERLDGDRHTGISDLVLGFKRHFADARGARPSAGWLVNVKLPTASGGMGNGHVEGNVLMVANKEFGDRLELEVNAGPGAAWDEIAFAQGLYAVTLSYVAPVRGRQLRLFGEAFGSLPAERDGGGAGFAGAGIQYWVNPRLAFDLGFQAGLTQVAKQNARTSFYIGAGILY